MFSATKTSTYRGVTLLSWLFSYYEIMTVSVLFAIGLVLTGATSVAMNLGWERAGVASAFMVAGICSIVGGVISPWSVWGVFS